MTDHRSGRPVLVGVENVEHDQQLVRTAGDLASLGSGSVRLVTVAVKGASSPVSVFTDETIVTEYAETSKELLAVATPPENVTIEREVVVGRSAARGLLKAVENADPAALVVGWQEQSSRTDAVFGTTVDSLVEHAACDLYVERVGHEANGVDSVLLPVAGGPHVETAARVAAAIATRNDATVVVYSVDTPSVDDADAFVDEGVEAVQATVGDAVPVERTIAANDDVTAAIVDEVSTHDVVVLGTTRQGTIRRKLLGSVPRRVVARTDRTVILARNGDVVGGPRNWLGRLFRG